MALGTFLDIEGAFDNVSFVAIERALSSNCGSNGVNQWIMSMIQNRKTTVELQGKKVARPGRVVCKGGFYPPSCVILREVTQKSLNSINQWFKHSGLKLSQLKTHCVMFTIRRNWSFSKPLKVDGAEIEVQNFRGPSTLKTCAKNPKAS